jgi:hypothetical protein
MLSLLLAALEDRLPRGHYRIQLGVPSRGAPSEFTTGDLGHSIRHAYTVGERAGWEPWRVDGMYRTLERVGEAIKWDGLTCPGCL